MTARKNPNGFRSIIQVLLLGGILTYCISRSLGLFIQQNRKQHVAACNIYNKSTHSHAHRLYKGIATSRDEHRLYREIILLMVSFLHGTLFFSLTDQLIELVNNYSFLKLSYILFYFAIFLRVFQTHILAAIKYTGKWSYKPLDFVAVFLTALFEYLLFSHKEIKGVSDLYFKLVFGFCVFGVFGYFTTYLRTIRNINKNDARRETLLQIINMSCIAVIGILHLLFFINIFPVGFSISILNCISVPILILNIYLSISLSKSMLKNELRM